MEFRSVNPYDGQILAVYPEISKQELNKRIERTHQTFQQWKNTPFETRTNLLLSVASELRLNKKSYAETISLEMGKRITESISEIEKCAVVCEYYAKHAPEFLNDSGLTTPHGNAYIHYNPLGVILAVMPWNFPYWQVFRFAAPAIMAGNTCLLKHASNVPKCALDIERVFMNAGLPEHVFTTLLISSSNVRQVIEHEHVAAVTLTGSEFAGQSVAAIAGKNLKKSVLELGGSDPFIVLHDADIPIAAKTAVKARMLNTGQSCIAAKRFIIENEIADSFTKQFIDELEKLHFGNPMDAQTDYGTLARQDLAEEIYDQVKKSIELGANIIYGNLPDKIDSAYFPPMILRNLKPGMPAFDDEIFGPVASFYVVKDEEEAITVANQCKYGLGGSLWTRDENKAKSMAERIESGAVYINQMMFSDPNVPFGGIKKSGYGRELSHLGIREFTNQKTIWIK